MTKISLILKIDWLPGSYKPISLLRNYIRLSAKVFFYVGFIVIMLLGGAPPFDISIATIAMTFRELIINILGEYGEDLIGVKGSTLPRNRNGRPVPESIFNKPLEGTELSDGYNKWYVLGGGVLLLSLLALACYFYWPSDGDITPRPKTTLRAGLDQELRELRLDITPDPSSAATSVPGTPKGLSIPASLNHWATGSTSAPSGADLASRITSRLGVK